MVVARVRRATVSPAEYRQDRMEVRELCIAEVTMAVVAADQRVFFMDRHLAVVQVVWVAAVGVKALHSLRPPLQVIPYQV